MTLKGHKKHTALIRPAFGTFGRNEWAILGAPCADIKLLAEQIIKALLPQTKITYADAQHSDEPGDTPGRLPAGVFMEYTQQGSRQQVIFSEELNAYHNKPFFNQADLILINGNHFQAKRQIVIINTKKKASLQKRVDQLTDVCLFLLADGEDDLFDFVKEAVPHYQDIPVCRLNETDRIIVFFEDEIVKAQPKLNALVLAGGNSLRMGQDKAAIHWHDKQQRYYMADLLKNYTDNVYISCRAGQQMDVNPAYLTLTDTFTGLGPFGAILSAFREQPENAWLVIACDLPLLDKETLDVLMANRDTSAIATTFESPDGGFPEPLIAVWEPKSYAVLLSFLSQGYACPRKVLINSDVKILQAPHPDALTNVNTPEEMERVQAIIRQKTVTA